MFGGSPLRLWSKCSLHPLPFICKNCAGSCLIFSCKFNFNWKWWILQDYESITQTYIEFFTTLCTLFMVDKYSPDFTFVWNGKSFYRIFLKFGYFWIFTFSCFRPHFSVFIEILEMTNMQSRLEISSRNWCQHMYLKVFKSSTFIVHTKNYQISETTNIGK